LDRYGSTPALVHAEIQASLIVGNLLHVIWPLFEPDLM